MAWLFQHKLMEFKGPGPIRNTTVINNIILNKSVILIILEIQKLIRH